MQKNRTHRQYLTKAERLSYEPYALLWHGENGFCLFSKPGFTRHILYHINLRLSTPFLHFFDFLHFLSFLQIGERKIVKYSVFTNTVLWVYNNKARIGAAFFFLHEGYINLMMFTSRVRHEGGSKSRRKFFRIL